MSHQEDNKETVRKFLKAVDGDDKDAALALLHEDHILHWSGGTAGVDREGHWALAVHHASSFSELTHRADFQIAEGDVVATRGTITGVHTGELLGVEPTGRSLSIQFMNFARIVDGRICGMWALADNATMQQQIGATTDVAYRPHGETVG